MESLSECSSVWYERLVRDQEAAGSSPVIPTHETRLDKLLSRRVCFLAEGKTCVLSVIQIKRTGQRVNLLPGYAYLDSL